MSCLIHVAGKCCCCCCCWYDVNGCAGDVLDVTVWRRHLQTVLPCGMFSWTAWLCAVSTALVAWTVQRQVTCSSVEARSTWLVSTSVSSVWPPSNVTASSSDDFSSGCSTSSVRFVIRSVARLATKNVEFSGEVFRRNGRSLPDAFCTARG